MPDKNQRTFASVHRRASIVIIPFRHSNSCPALWQLERNANTRLILENLFIKFPIDIDQ